ncbi:MAG: acetyl-CoA carboxylase biotin carboxyl carrier protein [Proteobacteria bacterium]|nr:acetyl-CoA carboxylase biotin carboxyl carrier protein [Pseudomonadota bacterium]
MDTRKIRKLIELVKETGIGELEIRSGDESVRISCQKGAFVTTSGATAAIPMETTLSHPVSQPSASAATVSNEANVSDGHHVLSPMVGTVYLAPSSGAMPFVQVGDNVKAGDTLCLIEAMKMFNKIEADVSGVVSARLIENEQPVEYGQPLFLIETTE